MNENENTNDDGLFQRLIGDEGVQRAVAGVAVAVIVAGVKRVVFRV